MGHLPAELDLPDFDFFAWDARGHGRSPGARGDSPSFGTSVRDVQTFIDAHRRASRLRSGVDRASSRKASARSSRPRGSTITRRAIRGMVLASPAFKVKLYVPLALPGLRLMRALRGNFFVTSYVKARLAHARRRSSRIVRHRPADRALDLGQHPAGTAAGLRPDRRRRGGDHRADAAPDVGPRLGRPRRPAARLLRAARLRDQGEARAAGLLPRHARRARPGDRDRHACARSCSVCSTARRSASISRAPIDTDSRRTKPMRCAAPLPRNSPRDLYWRATRATLRFGAHALRRTSGRPRDRVRFRQHARLRLSECRVRSHAAGAPARSHLSRFGGLARHPAAQAPRRGAAPRGDVAAALAAAGRSTSSTLPPATAATCSTPSPTELRAPTRSCCATTVTQTFAMAPR